MRFSHARYHPTLGTWYVVFEDKESVVAFYDLSSESQLNYLMELLGIEIDFYDILQIQPSAGFVEVVINGDIGKIIN